MHRLTVSSAMYDNEEHVRQTGRQHVECLLIPSPEKCVVQDHVELPLLLQRKLEKVARPELHLVRPRPRKRRMRLGVSSALLFLEVVTERFCLPANQQSAKKIETSCASSSIAGCIDAVLVHAILSTK